MRARHRRDCRKRHLLPQRLRPLTGLRSRPPVDSSGQYPRHCGCRRFGEDIAPDVVTYPQWFGNHGYYTASAGKMHFMGQDQMHGWQRRIGFDQVTPASAYAGFDGEAARDLADPIDGTGKWIWDDEVRNARYGEGYWARHDRYAVDGSLIFLDQFFAGPDYDRIGQRPLLLQVSLLMPHYPYICREDWFNYYLNRVEPYFDAPTEITRASGSGSWKWAETRPSVRSSAPPLPTAA